MKRIHAQLLIPCALVLIGCGAQPTPPINSAPPLATTSPASPTTGKITIECSPPDALVSVDGKVLGTAEQIKGRDGLTLPQGLHRFEISSPGFRPYRIELNLKAQTETIKIQLEADPQSP